MSRTVSPASGSVYGLARVCRIWRVSRATVHRHLSPPRSGLGSDAGSDPARRPARSGRCRMPHAHADPRHPGRQPLPRRRPSQGLGTAAHEGRAHLQAPGAARLMRAHDLLAPTRVGTPRGPRNHDGTIIPTGSTRCGAPTPDTTWTAEGQVAVFVAIDHCSAECVGIHAAAGARASRRWSRSAKGCGSASAASRPRSLPA